jgi:hypothetical protein
MRREKSLQVGGSPGIALAAASTHRPANAGPMTEIYLRGVGSLGRFIEFINDAVQPVPADLSALTAEWRSAVSYYQELEQTESGLALQGSHRDLDPEYRALADQLRADGAFQRTFDILPTTFGMVELDKLIVSQRSVTLNHIEGIQARIGRKPAPAALFAECFPSAYSAPPVEIRQLGEDRFTFRTESTNLRSASPKLVVPVRPAGEQNIEALAGVAGVAIGFGSNFLNVVRVGRRYLMNNGYHRACALYAQGITHAPCVIQTATHVDEVQAAAGARVASQAEFYLESARPPLLRDYFNPRLALRLSTRRFIKNVTVEISVSETFSYE